MPDIFTPDTIPTDPFTGELPDFPIEPIDETPWVPLDEPILYL